MQINFLQRPVKMVQAIRGLVEHDDPHVETVRGRVAKIGVAESLDRYLVALQLLGPFEDPLDVDYASVQFAAIDGRECVVDNTCRNNRRELVESAWSNIATLGTLSVLVPDARFADDY